MKVSGVKKYAIEEALRMWKSKADHQYSFMREMKSIGWKSKELHDSGAFKRCLWKNSIVIKYITNQANIDEIAREVEQYRLAPPGFRKYLPKIYAYGKDYIIQDRVLFSCNHTSGRCNVKEIANKYELSDYKHNHGHSLNGTVKFFDWVYRRDDAWVFDSKKPLREDNNG